MGDFAVAGDPSRTLGVPPGGFRAHILMGGCSFILTHMFPTRINHKTFCCNLFVVPPALYRTIPQGMISGRGMDVVGCDWKEYMGYFLGTGDIRWMLRRGWGTDGAHGSAWERPGARGSAWERAGARGSERERVGASESAWEREWAPFRLDGIDIKRW